MRSLAFLGSKPLFKIGETVKTNEEMYALEAHWLSSLEVIVPKGTSFRIIGQDWDTNNDVPIYDIQNSDFKIGSVPEAWLER